MPVRRKLFLVCCLLALLVFAMALFGVCFLVANMPQLESAARRRVAVMRNLVAHRLETGVLKPDFVWCQDAGVTEGDSAQWGAVLSTNLSRKFWGAAAPERVVALGNGRKYGAKNLNGSMVVWLRDGDRVLGKVVEEDIVDTRAVLCVGSLVIFIVACLTIFGVRYFYLYSISRDDFLAAAAHDLASPVAQMRYLIGKDDPAAILLASRLLLIVRNISKFMRLGARRSHACRPFDLAAACREAYALFADDFRNIYSGEDVPLEVECPDAPIVFADETATIQIIWNIFGNELKYAAHASRVKAKIHADGATVYLEISDTGPGMTRRELKRAFNRYWRAKTVRKSGQGGFGIGLCVAREEARAMGGDLALKANNPTGCRYILSLPAPAHRQ